MILIKPGPEKGTNNDQSLLPEGKMMGIVEERVLKHNIVRVKNLVNYVILSDKIKKNHGTSCF